MKIKKIIIKNFKRFKHFELELNDGINILVGMNEAGKSTILEAIHLALTGFFNGRLLKNELTEYIFNKEAVNSYLSDPNPNKNLPSILIEIYFVKNMYPLFEGNDNSNKTDKENGFSFKVAFDERYDKEYQELLKSNEIKTLPIEYYNIIWNSFARDSITPRVIPLKSALIDSSSNRYQNGSDIYISRIIREDLEHHETVSISQAHRQMRDSFSACEAIKNINGKLKSKSQLSNKKIELSVELLSKNAWENSLVTYLDEIPFHFIGKGEQCIVKTDLALGHKKSSEANIILMEEPENHLSHTKLNSLIAQIENNHKEKQIIISTHSSFVANKLGLDNLILLNENNSVKLNQLSEGTYNYFRKISGYDTLRLVLCKKAILVEGDSDELVVQKAYLIQNQNLPIVNGIDVISVGTSFLRFLEIAEKLSQKVVVVTDNDNNLDGIKNKYNKYIGVNKKTNILICFDEQSHEYNGNIEKYNNNTLEPALFRANDLSKLNLIFGTTHKTEDELLNYMYSNKTECAIKIFDTTVPVMFPEYILKAIKDE